MRATKEGIREGNGSFGKRIPSTIARAVAEGIYRICATCCVKRTLLYDLSPVVEYHSVR